MEEKKLVYHLASIVRLYLTELQDIHYFQEEVQNFFTETYSKEFEKDHPWYEFIKDLDKRLLGEKNNQLFKMIIVSCISIFEAFNKDFFKTLYTLRPENLKREEKVDFNYKELIEFRSIEALYEELARRKVDQFGRKSIDELAEELEKKHKFDLTKNFKKWKALREKYYRRNIIVHNKGEISKDFVEKIKDYNDTDIGKELDLSIDYVEDCISNVWVYIEFIFEKIGNKNKLEINYKEVYDLDAPISFLWGMDPRSSEWQNYMKEME